MNFHKTIGFLATLLLTLGLGVPNSYAQNVDGVTLTLNGGATLAAGAEGGTSIPVTVSVSVDFASTVTVSTSQLVTITEGITVTNPRVGAFTPPLPKSVTVTGLDGTNGTWTGVHIYTPPDEDDGIVARSFTLRASAGGQNGDAEVNITNSGGTTASEITIELDGETTVAATEGGDALAITVVVDVLVNGDDVKAGYTRPVEVSLADGSTLAGTFSPALPITVTAAVTAATVTADAADPDTARVTTTITYRPGAEDDSETVIGSGTLSADSPFGGQTLTAATATVTENDINIIDQITISLNGNNDADALVVGEGDDPIGVVLLVEVALDNVAGSGEEGDTREVVVNLATGSTLVGSFSQPLPITVTVTRAATAAASGEVILTYTPVQDPDADDETFTLEGSTAGEDDDTTITSATVEVTDDDEVSAITLTVNPMTATESGGAISVALGASVEFVAGSRANTNTEDVVVNLAPGSTLAGTFSPALPVTVTVTVTDDTTDPIAATGDAVTVTYTPPTDPDSDDPAPFDLQASLLGQTSDAVTFTVTDDSEPAGTITITTSISEIRENVRARDVVVTASLSEAAPAGGVTVAVEAKVEGASDVPTETVTVSVVIAAGTTQNSVTVSLDPSNDNLFTTRNIVVTGTAPAAGYTMGEAMIAILDDDDSIGDLTITVASPPSVTVGTATDVTLTVKGLIFDKEVDSGAVTVTVGTDVGMFSKYIYTDEAGDKVTVTVSPQSNSVDVPITMKDNVDLVPDEDSPDGTSTVTLSISAAEATAGTMITVTARADMYDGGSRVIPVTTRSALDIAGYRAVLVKPGENGWAPVGNDKVIVDVMRVGAVAYPWSQFESIKVSVRDTMHGDYEIDAVTAEGFNLEDNGAVTFEEPGSRSRGDVIWRGNDTIRFEIRIRPRNDQGSTDPASNGQYLGAYAHIEFASGSATPKSFTNLDDDKAVYPSNPTLVDEANRYRGDGKLFKVDNFVPANTAIAAVRVTSGSGDDEQVGGAISATVGDEIRVAVKVSGNILFRESGLRIQLQTHDGTGDYQGITYPGADVAPVTVTKTFTAAQVIASTSDSLRHTWTINEGFFKMKTDNYIEGIGAKGITFQPDNVRARVLVAIKDQAANWSSPKVTAFDADSRSPSVSILYPSADPDSIYEHAHPLRFTGRTLDVYEGQNLDDYLNPLAILVDEDLSELKVFVVGSKDTLDLTRQALDYGLGRAPNGIIGDSTAVYDTQDLSSTKKDGEAGTDDDEYPNTDYVPSSANVAGTDIELAVLATDMLGNTTKTTISGVTHDAARPEIKEWFPQSELLDDGQFNDATPPVFTLPEDVDSIAVRFTAPGGNDVTKERGGVTTKGEDSFDFSGELTDETSYDMTIFVRDLAGNVFITPAEPSSGMRFNAEFDNPVANQFSIKNMNGVTDANETAVDSVIAGQALIVEIQAEDHDAGSDSERKALTYKNAARISAWDTDGGAAESVWFEGTGVTDDADSPDGVAMLSAADWRIGKRTVTVKSNKATGFVKILVQHVDSGEGDTQVLGFDGAIDSLYVGAADFAGFEITAWEEGVEGEAPEIWGDYTLRVVPVDRHGNPSVRVFKAGFDSLHVLDTRVKDNALEYKNGIDVEIVGVPVIEDFALLILSVGKDGETYDLVAPADRRSQTVQVRVVNGSLMDADDRSQNIRSTAKFKISAPLEPVLTLWVPGSDVDEAGNDVVIPADPGDITVTVAAAGFNAGDMVTFTRNGTAGDPVAADDDGVARLMITASVVSTTTVSASNGLYSTDELTITFVDTPAVPARKKFVDANGDPVYLISAENMTVDVSDFLALVAAFGSSEGDDNYNAQADVNDDGEVSIADFSLFITSYGKTAVGPATKPLVLLPGINENAEFSLSLGSERVVAGELVAVDVSLANVAALVGYGFALNYENDKFEFVSVAPADEDLLKSTGGETLFHHVVADGQVTVANGLFNGTAISGGGDAVRFVFRVLREFEDNARFEIANGLVFDPSQLQNPAVVAGVLELQSTPREFALHQNFPNPFNPDTTIKYDLAESADVTLQIYNVLGQVVRTLVASEAQNAGRYQIRWNGMDDRGVSVSSGIYFYQISADGMFSDVRKLMLLK